MTHKLPAIQFYPGDWKKDPGIQSLTYHQRGVWFELLLLMHESEQRGRLLLNGMPMPEQAIAVSLGLDNQEVNQIITTLLTYGVASRDESGALVCRRMLRDEELRKIRTQCGKLGGNPNLVNQNITTRVNQKSTPSSSSSSSKDKENRSCPPAGGPDPNILLTIWNTNRGTMPAATMTAGRRNKARARMAEKPDPNYWTAVVVRMATSRFCTGQVDGRNGGKPWRATFDFLIANDTNHVKVMEGKYDDAPTVKTGVPAWM